MIKFVVTLKSGGDFKSFDVLTLQRQVRKHMTIPHQFICITDMMDDFSVNSDMPYLIELKHGWPGWWSMIEMFCIAGPVIAAGLDMIVLKDISRLAELAMTCPLSVFYMARPQPRPLKKGEKWCSGLQIWNGDWSWLYNHFCLNPWSYIDFHVKEQRFTYNHLIERSVEIRAVQDYFDGYYSYKNDCQKGKPEDARVVLFHGRPRPNQCKEPWVKRIYNNRYEYIHPMEVLNEANHAFV
jgi:hypothetical protein